MNWVQTIITIACSVLASSGFWAYLMKREEKKDVKTRMLIGLGHDRIMYLIAVHCKSVGAAVVIYLPLVTDLVHYSVVA